MLTSAGYPANSIANMEVNMVADGLFDASNWLITVVGVVLLWRAKSQTERAPFRILVGSAAVGWGFFNLVEGIVDHQILGIHHVHSGPNQLAWDMGFLALGAILAIVGWVFIRSVGRKQPAN